MDALILGGNSPHNKEWVRQLRGAVAPLFGTVAVHDYSHWASAESTIDFNHELRAIQREIRQLGQNYAVLAKSAGAMLCLKGMFQNVARPQKAVFFGLPLKFARTHGLDTELSQWVAKTNIPLLFVQNAHDPVASAAELGRYLAAHLPPARFSLAELPGETHDYTDFPRLFELTQNYISA